MSRNEFVCVAWLTLDSVLCTIEPNDGTQCLGGDELKLLIMGTGPFAVPSFRALLESKHEVLCLVTRPDKPSRGRKKLAPNPMRAVAEQANVEVLAPDRINSDEGLAILDRFAAELFVVCDYGQILSADALSRSQLGGINLHGSLLPRYRGAAPINWALLNGDQVAGVTVIHMTPRLDGGPMICKRSIDVGTNEDAIELEERLSALGVDAVLESIQKLANWNGSETLGELQDAAQVTKAPRLKKSDGAIDWSKSAKDIFNQVRALKPWPGTYTNLLRSGRDPMRILVKSVELLPNELDGAIGQGRLSELGIEVRCGTGSLRLTRLQPAGKREMDAQEFSRGYGTEIQFDEI